MDKRQKKTTDLYTHVSLIKKQATNSLDPFPFKDPLFLQY